MKKVRLIGLLLLLSLFATMNVKAAIVSIDDIENSTYMVGKYMFTRNINEDTEYDGKLTTRRIMLAAKTIEGNTEADMIIYYKNARGIWTDALSGDTISNLESFEVISVDLERFAFDVTFNSNGGTAVPAQTVAEGTAAVEPEAPIKTGYTFKEWQLNGVTYDFSTPVTENITLVAVYDINKFTVTFDSNGGTEVAEQVVNYLETPTIPEAPTKTGYTFLEWQLNGNTYSFGTPITENITLVASYQINRYAVTFNSNGGTQVQAQMVEYLQVATEPTSPTKTGHTFKEWQLNGIKYDFATPVTSDVALVAAYDINKYAVTFNSDGGSAVQGQMVDYNTTATMPTNPTKTGYTFVEWQLGGVTYDFTTPVTENIMLKAVWTINQYGVTFNSVGGSFVQGQMVDYNTTATMPTNPTKTGYTFVEWQLGGVAYDFATPVTGNITLTAYYEINKYTVTFNSNGGSSVDEQIVEYNGNATRPTDPTRQFYEFKYWTLNGNEYNFNASITRNITLVAEWEEKRYTITATPVDTYSPDRILKVFLNGVQIEFTEILVDEIHLCYATNPVAGASDIEGVEEFQVVLTNGTTVTAVMQ